MDFDVLDVFVLLFVIAGGKKRGNEFARKHYTDVVTHATQHCFCHAFPLIF